MAKGKERGIQLPVMSLSIVPLFVVLATLATTSFAQSIATFTPPSPGPFEYLTSSWQPKSTFTKLGGFSPWFPATGVYGIEGTDVPEGCTVNQVQMYSRHHERLASGGTHTAIQAVAAKLANASFAFTTYVCLRTCGEYHQPDNKGQAMTKTCNISKSSPGPYPRNSSLPSARRAHMLQVLHFLGFHAPNSSL